MKKLHYEKSGDNYKLKDPFKIVALRAASSTSKNIKRFKKYGLTIEEVISSRGESAYRFQIKSSKKIDVQIAHVEESIGTKNVIADQMARLYKKSFYHSIGVDNVASILNDLSTCGAFPLSFMLHLAAFPNEWYLEANKINDLLQGTADACNIAGVTWGGGESATDRDIIAPGMSLLSGSATGIILSPGKALSEDRLKAGDRIILLSSSGVHTNGITLLRKELLDRLPKGYKTKLSDGTTYGEALLTPSVIYSKLIEQLINNTEIHYAVHITGHGWRKIFRANKPFTYVIEQMPKAQAIFELIQKNTNSTDKDMYDTYNMGAGFALFVPARSVKQVMKIAKKLKIGALDAGYVQKGPKQLIIEPLGVKFTADDMRIR